MIETTNAKEVDGLTCRYCKERVHARINLAKHEQYCTQNPRGSYKPEVDMRRANHAPISVGANPGLRVMTCNVAAVHVDFVDRLVAAGFEVSRSEFIRRAMANEILVMEKLMKRLE